MSDSARDPYVGLLGEMRRQSQNAAPEGVCLGVVRAVGPGVLQVQTDTGLQLDTEDLWINPLYTYDAEELLTLELPDTGEVSLAVDRQISCLIQFSAAGQMITVDHMTLYSVPGKLTGQIRIKTQRLQAGDRVLLLPSADGQTYYLITKVVRP